VFFADEVAAIAAGYRPCAICLSEKYRAGKEQRWPSPMSPHRGSSTPS
jgi:methylphosphotriester-DNA--protein-cysteine methyltransferase